MMSKDEKKWKFVVVHDWPAVGVVMAPVGLLNKHGTTAFSLA